MFLVLWDLPDRICLSPLSFIDFIDEAVKPQPIQVLDDSTLAVSCHFFQFIIPFEIKTPLAVMLVRPIVKGVAVDVHR